MNKIKELYSSPTTKILVVKFGGDILAASGQMDAKNWTSGNSSWWTDDEE